MRLVHLEVSSPAAGGSGGANPFGVQFTADEEEEFGEMARSEGFYERFAKSVAPSIFGSLGMFRSPVLTAYADVSNRHQKGNNLSTYGWLEEDTAGWYAPSRRHQCVVAW